MKKFLKWFLIILGILVVLYLAYSMVTAKIYFNIYTAMKEKVNTTDEFYAKMQLPQQDTYVVSQEYFIKDNIFIHQLKRTNIETNDEVILKKWQEYKEGEGVTGYFFIESTADGSKTVEKIDVKDAKEPKNKMYRYDISRSLVMGVDADDFFTNMGYEDKYMKDYTYSKILLGVIKHPTILYSKTIDDEKCYAIKYVISDIGNYLISDDIDSKVSFADYCYLLFSGLTEYVSKETKLPVGVDGVMSEGRTVYNYFTKSVTEEDIKMPNLEEYELITNN